MQILHKQRIFHLIPALFESYTVAANYKSFLNQSGNHVISNIQQLNTTDKGGWVLMLLMEMLGAITYVKVFFGSELQDMVHGIVNRNLSQQLFRTQSGEITFSSFLLHLNFIVAISLYVRFIAEKHFHLTTSNQFTATTVLIFLFTFFYFGKILFMNVIGVVFELKEECSLYVNHFTILCKTLGLTLIPALFVFYTAPKIFINFVFVITSLIAFLFFLLFIFRGLSTAVKLMYRSMYHFFIYVCVVEISTVFLFFKLLTKTII